MMLCLSTFSLPAFVLRRAPPSVAGYLAHPHMWSPCSSRCLPLCLRALRGTFQPFDPTSLFCVLTFLLLLFCAPGLVCLAV